MHDRHCQVASLEVSKLSQLSMLAVLDLQNNAIASVPPELGIVSVNNDVKVRAPAIPCCREPDPDPESAAGGQHVPGAAARGARPGHARHHELSQGQDPAVVLPPLHFCTQHQACPALIPELYNLSSI